MAKRTRRMLALAATVALLGVVVPPAFGQSDLGDVLGTTLLNGILTDINLPQVPVPDPTTGTTQTQTQTQPTQTQTTPAPPPHAAGYYCKGESKRHARGFKGTPFNQCVNAMGRLRQGSVSSPAKACTALTKKHFPGMKRTPYAVCVAGGRRLLADTH